VTAHARVARPLAGGKLPVELLTALLAELPAWPPELRLGPRASEDACAIEIPAGILVAATDPITLASEELGRLAVIVNANDVAVTGARPRWFLAVVLVPPGAEASLVRSLFRAIQAALAGVGATLVGGHTEVTPVVTRPVVVGQMLGLAEGGTFVATAGARPGDAVVQVGPAPVEGTALLAKEAAGRLTTLDAGLLAAARTALDSPGISIVEPALLATRLGATALHDPTEGGLAAGLHELAAASDVSIRVEQQSVLWFEPGLAVCREVGADPWATLASGTLLAAFPAEHAAAAQQALAAEGHVAAVIGSVEEGSGVRAGGGKAIPWPERDEVDRVLLGDSSSATSR
jgi:hydrogenase maturation factor